jgi:transketolase C-terminal domain/subunit
MTLTQPGGLDVWLAVLVGLAGLVGAVLAGLGLAAFLRRRSRSYLLVALALVALFARTVVAVAAMTGVLDGGTHHLLEHGLDTAMAALVVAAIYYARSVTNDSETATDGGTDE